MQQIADWLERLGMSEYAERFAENDIDFAILSDMTDHDFEKIGVASLGHRRELLRAIAVLNDGDKGTPKPAVTPPPQPQDTAERRQVTVMFSDLVGSTALSARMDPEDLHEIISSRNASPKPYAVSVASWRSMWAMVSVSILGIPRLTRTMPSVR